MTLNPAVERVVALLRTNGFVARPRPVRLGSIDFDFAAVLTAERGLDLVVVADTAEQSIDRVGRSLAGLSRALDRMASRRPITVVLVGPRPTQAAIDALAVSGRVLAVGTPQGDADVRSATEILSVLLPLNVPDIGSDVGSMWQNLVKGLGNLVAPQVSRPLLEASPHGAEAVRAAMKQLILEALDAEQKPK